MDNVKAPVAITSSSPSAAYPGSSEFNVLVQRFKLLNLVQRVAHRDVSEMLDTIGLDALSYKGTLSRWGWHNADDASGDEEAASASSPRGTGYKKAACVSLRDRRSNKDQVHPLSPRGNVHSTSTPSPRMQFLRPSTGLEARITAARANRGTEEAAEGQHIDRSAIHSHFKVRSKTSTDAPATRSPTTATTRRQYVVRRTRRIIRRSAAEQSSFFSRLAEPRARPEPVMEDIIVYDAFDGDHRSRSREAAHSDPVPFPSEQQRARGEGRNRWKGYCADHTDDSRSPRLPESRSLPHRSPQDSSASRDNDLRTHYYSVSPYPVPQKGQDPMTAASAIRSEPYHDDAGEGAPHRSRGFSGSSPSSAPPRLPFAGDGARGVPSTLSPQRRHPSSHPPTSEVPARGRKVNFAPLQEADLANVMEVTDGFSLGGRHPDSTQATASPPGSSGWPAMTSNSAMSPLSEDGAPLPSVSEAAAKPSRQVLDDAPSISQLHLPTYGGGDSGTYDADDAAQKSTSASGLLGYSGGASPPAGAGNSRSASASQLPKSPRIGRGLAPKAKPKGAMDNPRVPLEAVRHAAALLSRSEALSLNATGAGSGADGVVKSDTVFPPLPAASSSLARTPPVSLRFAGDGTLRSSLRNATTTENADGRHSVEAATSSPGGADAGTAPVNSAVAISSASLGRGVHQSPSLLASAGPEAGVQERFYELATAIDDMLRDHQHLLHQVYKGPETPGQTAVRRHSGLQAGSQQQQDDGQRTSFGSETDARSSSLAGNTTTAGKTALKRRLASNDNKGRGPMTATNATIEVELDSDACDEDSTPYMVNGEVEDELLLYTRLEDQLTRLDADMTQLGLSNEPEADQQRISQGEKEEGGAYTPLSATAVPHLSSPEEVSRRLLRQRHPHVRGEVPDVVVQRLCAYRMDHFQYIAYNERLWNTSTVSQFVFAQRLTAALLEECWEEVMAEVGAIMDEYVEGLAGHELQ